MKRLYAFLFALNLATIGFSQPLQRVAPEQVGMSSELLKYADDAINNEILQKRIPGAVLAVVKNGKMAYLKAYGNERIYPTIEPMTVGTVFDMASCSKAMSTAICVHILAEQGKIRMLDAVNMYLPEFKDWTSDDGKEKQTIRIEDLMTHTSGLPSYITPDDLKRKCGDSNHNTLMNYIDSCHRDFRPKTDFQYSCLNYITLQRIIEKISGQTLRQFARKNIFEKLGMKFTDYLPCKQDDKGIWVNTSDACWSTLMKGDWHNIIAPTEKQASGQVLCGQVHDPLARICNNGVSGNAGLFSSADDIAILCAALQNGGEWNGKRILSPLAVKAMRTVPRAVAQFGRSLGWDVYSDYSSNKGDYLSPDTYCHSGYTGTSIVIDPDNDLSIILLVNAVHPEDKYSVVRLRSIVANAVAGAMIK
jgi:CubicO group peptidase (beta-lactamase class C family)